MHAYTASYAVRIMRAARWNFYVIEDKILLFIIIVKPRYGEKDNRSLITFVLYLLCQKFLPNHFGTISGKKKPITQF